CTRAPVQNIVGRRCCVASPAIRRACEEKNGSASTISAPARSRVIAPKAASIWLAVLASTGEIVTLFAFSVAQTRFNKSEWSGLAGFTSTVTRDNLGTAARSSSRYLLATSALMLDRPVIFRPGRDRLWTNPLPTGSPVLTMTMGMVVVACLAACTAGVH